MGLLKILLAILMEKMMFNQWNWITPSLISLRSSVVFRHENLPIYQVQQQMQSQISDLRDKLTDASAGGSSCGPDTVLPTMAGACQLAMQLAAGTQR